MAGAIVSVGAVGYAAVRLVSDTDDALKRVSAVEEKVERHETELRGVARVEGKVDAIMYWLGVPKPSASALPAPGPVMREAPEVTP